MPKESDESIREMLHSIDEDDETSVTSWEANFLESVLYGYTGPLSDSQRKVAYQIIEKYF